MKRLEYTRGMGSLLSRNKAPSLRFSLLSVTRLSEVLTRGFASPPHDGFALIEKGPYCRINKVTFLLVVLGLRYSNLFNGYSDLEIFHMVSFGSIPKNLNGNLEVNFIRGVT